MEYAVGGYLEYSMELERRTTRGGIQKESAINRKYGVMVNNLILTGHCRDCIQLFLVAAKVWRSDQTRHSPQRDNQTDIHHSEKTRQTFTPAR
ncbi:hypothetical protein ElyMa_001321800 [Elysia marginata]|uniref:Uncharacterized protein n=1 Tax=Elysia marginata TaxID=1093978 RepID=A0AAV4IN32_9GAST|nr:hypothetical protein ElyMa_001321800 [Elysia marginata]